MNLIISNVMVPVNGKPDCRAFLDATLFLSQTVTIQVDQMPEGSTGLRSIDQSDQIKGTQDPHHERLRPQFHFTSRRGWLNDPDRLVYFKGGCHLFYQHNPYGWDWGNMSWGHAVSKDPVHCKELPAALCPDEHQTPFCGEPRMDQPETHGNNTLIRLRNLDCISFRKSLQFDIELLPWKRGAQTCAATTDWHTFPSATANVHLRPEAAAFFVGTLAEALARQCPKNTDPASSNTEAINYEKTNLCLVVGISAGRISVWF